MSPAMARRMSDLFTPTDLCGLLPTHLVARIGAPAAQARYRWRARSWTWSCARSDASPSAESMRCETVPGEWCVHALAG
jgi:hypothetical protein